MKALALAVTLAVIATVVPSTIVTAFPDQTPICHRVAADNGGNQHNGYSIIRPDHKSHDAHLGETEAGPANQHPPKHGRQDFVAIEWSDGSYHCEQEPRTPPEEPPVVGGGFDATAFVCGDPRVILTTSGPRNKEFRITYTRARDGERVTVSRWHKPPTTTYSRFWVKGKTWFVVRGVGGKEFLRLWVGRATNTGPCPRG